MLPNAHDATEGEKQHLAVTGHAVHDRAVLGGRHIDRDAPIFYQDKKNESYVAFVAEVEFATNVQRSRRVRSILG